MQKIAASELIINSRGAVYHLDLRPEELADTIILVGDPDRVKKVSNHFDSIECRQQHREFITHTGYVGNKRISVLSTGIGPDNIDIAINELDALANIDFETRTIKPVLSKLNIIRFGTSGSLQADIPVDSLVASTHGLGLDNLMNYYAYTKSAEEKYDTQKLDSRTTKEQKILQVKSDKLRVEIFDDGEIDNDIVSVYFNKKMVVDNKSLTVNGYVFNLELVEGKNELVLYADNLGTIPPNTALMIITDGVNRYELRLAADLKTNASVRFEISKPPKP